MQIYEKNVALIKLTKINMPKSAIPYYCCKSLKMLYIKYTYIFEEHWVNFDTLFDFTGQIALYCKGNFMYNNSHL